MRNRLVCLATVVAVVGGACGGGDTSDSPQVVTSAPSASTTLADATATTAAPTASSTTRPEDVLQITVELDLAYSTEFALDVYYPNAEGPWPVAVVFHGGEEPKSGMRTYASQVAERGVVVFVPEYSSTPEQVSEDLHAGAEDAACAMRYARVHASEFGGTGDRIVTAGHSYGGNVAALMVSAGDQFKGDCLVGSDASALADGFVGLDGMYDFSELPLVLGFHDDYTEEELDYASAISYVETSSNERVRFILFTGKEPAAQHQAELFRTRLVDADYDVEVIAQPDLSHAAFGSGAPGTVEALVTMASRP